MKLDQAIALVPERWEWTVGSGSPETGDSAWANVWPYDQPFPKDFDIYEEGSDPADALEKAATRARALIGTITVSFSPPKSEENLCSSTVFKKV